MDISRSCGVRRSHHMKLCPIDVTYSVRSWSHSCGSSRSSCGVLPNPSRSCGSTARTLSSISRSRRWSSCHMQFLLMPKKKISAGEASCAFWTLERLFLCMRSLVTFEMLQSRKRPLARPADMRARFVCFGRKVWHGLGVTGGVISYKGQVSNSRSNFAIITERRGRVNHTSSVDCTTTRRGSCAWRH